MEQRAIVDLLGKTALFGSLAGPDRAAIAARMRRVDFDADQMIFSRGDPGREIYLVLEGKHPPVDPLQRRRELSFAHAGPGSIFGEIATLDGGERTAGPPPSPASRPWRCRSGRPWS
jgi:CRP-like cAMP-binding protein